jgi:hypothetical protein
MVAGVLAGVLVSLAGGARAEAPPVAYVGLKYDLVRRGLDKGFVFQTFADSRNDFLPDVVRKILPAQGNPGHLPEIPDPRGGGPGPGLYERPPGRP